jgi:guanosine-3',5'-bis(diphosphate) 3'-pyrophosphohydrolase
LLNRVLRQFGHEVLDRELSLFQHYQGRTLSYQQRRALVMAVAQGESEADEIVRSIFSARELSEPQAPASSVGDKERILVSGEHSFTTKVASCCAPVYGDSLMGYVTRGGFVSIHRKGCKVLRSLDSRRILDAWWAGLVAGNPGNRITASPIKLGVLVSVANVLTDLSQILKERGIQLLGYRHEQEERGHRLVFELGGLQEGDIAELIRVWKSVRGVEEVSQLRF